MFYRLRSKREVGRPDGNALDLEHRGGGLSQVCPEIVRPTTMSIRHMAPDAVGELAGLVNS